MNNIFRYILLLLSTLFSLIAQAQNLAEEIGDTAAADLLVSYHKVQYNGLGDRNNKLLQLIATDKRYETIVKTYKYLHKKLNSKIDLLSQWIQVGVTGVDIFKEIKQSKQYLQDFINTAGEIENMEMAREYIKAGREVYKELELCGNIAKKIAIIRFKVQDVYEILTDIKMRLSAINRHLYGASFMARGWKVFMKGNKYIKYKGINQAKIAVEILKEMKPLKLR